MRKRSSFDVPHVFLRAIIHLSPFTPMFFILSNLFSFLTMPLTICIMLIAGSFFVPSSIWKKGLNLLGLVLLLFFSNGMIANFMINWWEPPFKPMDEPTNYEIGIVLTGVTNLNKTASDRTFFDRGADRATHAIQLYKQKRIKKILITGGQGLTPANDQREAQKLAEFMIIAGVAQDDILIEDLAVNTFENAIFSRDMLISLGYPLDQKHLLITSAFHMYRAERCFAKAGLSVESFPVDYYGNDRDWDIALLLQPSPYALTLWHKMVKEWVGISVYKLAGYI